MGYIYVLKPLEVLETEAYRPTALLFKDDTSASHFLFLLCVRTNVCACLTFSYQLMATCSLRRCNSCFNNQETLKVQKISNVSG